MKLLTIDTQPGSAPGVLTEDGRALNLANAGESGIPSSVRDILNVGLDGLTTITDYLTSNSGKAEPLEEVSLLAPVPNPNLILSVGLNYWKHLEEMAGTPVPKHPTAFHKARATLTGSGKNIHKLLKQYILEISVNPYCLIAGYLIIKSYLNESSCI